LRSIIINYGLDAIPAWVSGLWANKFVGITSKLRAFERFKAAGIPTPEWTTNIEEARQWISAGKIVVCRTLLNAHSGRGIVLLSEAMPNPLNIPVAPLYVLYKKKRSEYRVHVFDGKVIDVSEKRRRNGSHILNPEGYIRNLANGWVFCRDGVVEPADLRDLATKAVSALGLTFGACDIIWNEHENKCYVLEVNTAPGLEGTTLQRYMEAIVQWINSN
jgi:glutathione synthase/RimK-type ligase-like ATP-grasp enzyme